MKGDEPLDLGTGLVVTPEDRAALQRLRQQAPSWLDWDWRTLTGLVPDQVLAGRPTANDTWQPFVLGG